MNGAGRGPEVRGNTGGVPQVGEKEARGFIIFQKQGGGGALSRSS